jgi:hypothetical protein
LCTSDVLLVIDVRLCTFNILLVIGVRLSTYNAFSLDIF